MKSLFSCFPRRQKKTKSKNNSDNAIVDYKEKNINNGKVNSNNSNTETNGEIVNQLETVDKLIQIEKQKLLENEKKQLEAAEIQKHNDLIKRMEESYRRINNVFMVLNGKRKMYNIDLVIQDFENVLLLFEYNLIDDDLLNEKSVKLQRMVQLQIDLLKSIRDKAYQNLQAIFIEWKQCVRFINTNCDKTNELFEIHRILSDSILVFGWVNCSESPKEFVNSTSDGCAVCINNLLTNKDFFAYTNFLRLWMQIIKRIANIISKNFQIALIWGINGKIPIDIIESIMQSNYANEAPERISGKQKVLKTKRPEEVTYDEMSSLMSDLKEGKLVNKLKKTTGGIRYQNTANNFIQELRNLQNKDDLEIKSSTPFDTIARIVKCEACSIHVSTGVKLLKIENSKSLHLLLDDIHDHMEIKECDDLEIQLIGEKFNKLSVANCRNVKLYLPLSVAGTFQLTKNVSNENLEIHVTKNEDGGIELEDFRKCDLNEFGRMIV